MWYVWGTGEVHTGFWCGDQRERGHLEDLGVYGSMILKWNFKKWNGGTWTGYAAGMRQVVGSCECRNEPSVSMKYGEVLVQRRLC